MVSVKFMTALLLLSFIIIAFSSFAKGAALIENEQPLRFNEEVLFNSSDRSKRDIACRSNQWRCLYQEQCIAKHSKCDGQVDCTDGSDEIFATCRNKVCPQYLFRCAYGACVDRDAQCDRFQHCADNSDEENAHCKPDRDEGDNPCSSREWRCDSVRCIPRADVCDGVRDCADGSDETLRQCGRHVCTSYLFRCGYGACVDRRAACNGVQECADNSDESAELCNGTISSGLSATARTPALGSSTVPLSSASAVTIDRRILIGAGRGCVLPAQPEHGSYTTLYISEDPSLKSPSAVMLTYSCHKGHSLIGKNMLVCNDNIWTAESPVCEKQCSPLESTSVDFKCYKQHSTIPIPCNQLQDHNSFATAECKDSYHSELPPENVTCIGGSWTHTPICTPNCGTVTPQVDPLVMWGRHAKFGEFPWHVGIYEMPGAQYLCGGSIFSPKLVVTAAHCVCRLDGTVKLASSFSVAAGKLFMGFNSRMDTGSHVQKSNLTEIIIGERYKGVSTGYQSDIAILVLDRVLVLSSLVLPVCVRFEDIDREDRLGKVPGWGTTEKDGKLSRILKTVELPFVSYEECYDNSPSSFKSCITLDKFCAGYKNGTGLCYGDSGGGLVLPRQDGHRELFHLHGIVSISPRTNAITCSFAYIAFTDLSEHREWFRRVWAMYK